VFRDDGELWHTSVITECEGPHCVRTISGSEYTLLGNLDVERATSESRWTQVYLNEISATKF